MWSTNRNSARFYTLPGTMRHFGSSKQQIATNLIIVTMLLVIGCLCFVEFVSASQITNGPSNPLVYNNNLDDLISNLLDDAGERLKKSKVNGLRQVKQTLRFGRRSDPWFAPTLPSGQQISLDELEAMMD